MTEIADHIVSNLVNNLYNLLSSEAKFLLGVDEQVRLINDELQHMKNFLKNSEGKRKQHREVMILVDQIRDVACDVEDMVDTYVINIAKESRKNKAVKFFSNFNKATMLHNVGVQLQQLKTRITKIYGDYEKYKIPQNVDETQESPNLDPLQERRMEVEEDDVVGFVEEAEKLVNELVQGVKELDVISISGMGGLGKTTLAKKVYNDQRVKDGFRDRAWVSVSQNFKLKELLLEILKVVTPITEEILEMREEQLKQELKKQLSHHKYLVVLDDIWNADDWDKLKKVFPNDKNGSRVFVTTRYANIARHASSGKDPLRLRFLYPKESWELFTKKVFGQKSCPTDLQRFGKDIVAKCGGLPLAIVVLGGLLASKVKTYNSWKDVLKSVGLLIARDTICLKILGLSYRDLPPYLQRCFLYLGLFPEDYKIPARKLVQLWISEGFIPEHTRILTEVVANGYLQLLIDRSLIQVEERTSDGGGIKICRVHDITRELCLQLSEEEKFLVFHSGPAPPQQQTKPRRLSTHCSLRDYIPDAKTSNTCSVRTLLYFNRDSHKLSEEDWKSLFKSFKFLRVLDLGDGEIPHLPKAIHKLILLKYLRVKTAPIAGIPSTICSLDQLQTLDLRMCQINAMPEGIWNMRQLRHLYLDGCTRLPKNAGGKRLSNLQTLCYISGDGMGEVHIAESAPNLRKLGLYGYLCNSLDEKDFTFNLPYLETLKFANECLFKMAIELPSTVTKITIKKAYLKPTTIEMFQNLSKLRILKLDGASFEDNELLFQKGWFPELQLLTIEDSTIVRWRLEEGAAQQLKRVVISDCPGLTSPPEELWNLANLKELEFSRLSRSFTNAIGEFKKSDLKVVIYPAAP